LPTVAGTIDLVVHLQRGSDGVRRVIEIIAPTGKVLEGVIESTPVFERHGTQLLDVRWER
jgi:pilus assembly protein CpaF